MPATPVRRRFSAVTLVAAFVLAALVNAPAMAAEPAGKRPNIIVIMSDDMGYSDLGCYGGEIATPNLDALARGGVRFTQFYNTARCCPTRAALLTGLYSHQAGIGHMMEDRSGVAGEAYAGDLSPKSVTIAEVLKPAGYATYAVGKWHVTKKTRPAGDADKANWPRQRGFDRFYGTIHGAGSFFDPNTLVRDDAFISPFTDKEYEPQEFYYTDAINDHAARFVAEHHRDTPDKPFFLYVAHTAAHWPMHAKPADIAKYRGKYDSGYEAIRTARREKMKRLGLLDSRWQAAPQAGDWNQVENKAWETRCMEVYAAMIDCMDQGIGRLVETLRQNGQLENTLILFLQDNGGCAEGMGRNGPYVARGDAPTLAPLANDYLQPDMIPKQTRDGFPMRQGAGVMPGGADTYIGYGQAWANVSNTPFREYKHWSHEGGISTPLVAHWPAGIQAAKSANDPEAGRMVRTPAHLIDIMATCIDLAGATYPTERQGQAVTSAQGVSLRPVLTSSDAQLPKRLLYWEHEGNRAVRDGDWKLVSKHPGDWELYDVAADRTEMHDLAGRHPERVKEMAAEWDAWAKRVGVRPWPLGGAKAGAGKKKGRS
jgi:arylsulfatase